MNVYVDIPFQSYAIQRVVDDLKLYVPAKVQIVSSEQEADLVVLHIIGRRDATLRKAQDLRKQGKRYAIIQYCLRSTKEPNTEAWREIWQGAHLIWSYYNLPALIKQDRNRIKLPNFLHSPLGVHCDVFHCHNTESRKYIIATNGGHRLTESIREAKLAADHVGRPIFHVGNPIGGLGVNVEFANGMTDHALADHYNECEFVAGLRRTEGFELEVVEGALCGARPIVFDAPHYHQWYGDFAELISEGPREEVYESLVKLFKRGAKPMRQTEMDMVAVRFDVSRIIDEFWRRVLWTPWL